MDARSLELLGKETGTREAEGAEDMGGGRPRSAGAQAKTQESNVPGGSTAQLCEEISDQALVQVTPEREDGGGGSAGVPR